VLLLLQHQLQAAAVAFGGCGFVGTQWKSGLSCRIRDKRGDEGETSGGGVYQAEENRGRHCSVS
jgi:hypothetical protein